MAKANVSFIILNWNGLADTLECIKSIKNQIYDSYEIIVVDNGSDKSQKEHLRRLSGISLIDLPKNTGFTGGQIAALKAASGKYLALINNDAVIARDWCMKALEIMQSDSNIAAIGGRAYDWNEANDLHAFNENNTYSSYQVVNPVSGHCSTLKTGAVATPVNSISGAAVLVNRKIIDQVGYFDDSFFAYYEETDLFARMKRAGYLIMYCPDLKVWHKIGQSTKSEPSFYLYQMHRNRFKFALKNFDTRNAFSFLRFYFINEWGRSLLSYIHHGSKTAIEQRMLIKAGFWNLSHLINTLSSRHKTRRLGYNYSKSLGNDAGEDISVIIPCYNYADFVEEAISSAANQTLSPTIITVINDGSTDNSLEQITKVVNKLSYTHSHIEFNIIDQENRGIIATKNRGINEARTLWTIFLDADDILESNYLEKCVALRKIEKADVVYTDMQMFGAVDYSQKVLPYNKYRLRAVNFIHNSALYRTQLLKSIGGYNKEFSIGFEDWELNLNLSKITKRFSYIPEPLLLYRRHSGSSRDNNAQQKIEIVVKLLEKLHPELYNLRYYFWLETSRAIDSLKQLIKYPFYLLRHTYYHGLMFVDRRSNNNKLLRQLLVRLRAIKHKKDIHN